MQMFKKLLVLSGVIVILTGCSGTSTTSVSTTEISREPDSGEVSRYEDTTTVKVSEEENGHGLFAILGDIIAWPFRVIGSAL